MSMRLLPKEPIMLRDTSAQDRVIEPKNPLKRHRKLILAALAGVAALGALILILARYSGAGASVDRARVSIATVERGNFVRDIAADGQVVAAVSPTLYANALGTVTLKVHAGDTVAKGQVLAVVDSPDLTAKMSQEDATLVGQHLDWERATLDAEHRLSQLRDAYNQAQVDQKTAQRERDRSRKAYELGSYSELQALRAEDALEKAQFAFQQAKSTFDAQPKQNRFDIDSKKALFDRQQYLVTDLKRQVALEMLRLTKPDGLILWYDFFFDNPKNPNVRGIGGREIRRLFPGCSVTLRRVTLAPPLTRWVASRSWLVCSLLDAIPLLRTHFVGVIRKGRR